MDWSRILHLTGFSENTTKNRSHPNRWLLKWSRGDKVLLPALSGVVKTFVLTLQRYKLIMKVPNFWGIICFIDEIYLYLKYKRIGLASLQAQFSF